MTPHMATDTGPIPEHDAGLRVAAGAMHDAAAQGKGPKGPGLCSELALLPPQRCCKAIPLSGAAASAAPAGTGNLAGGWVWQCFFFFAPHFLPLSVSLSTKDSVYFGAGNAAREGPTLISAKLRRKKVLRSRPPRRSALRGAGAAAAARARPQSVSLLRAGAVPRRVLRVPRRVLSSVPHRWGVLRACGAHRVPFPGLWVPGP